MNDNSYTATIKVAQSPGVVFNCINEIPKWWTKDFEGSNSKPGDEFVICHLGQHYSKQQLTEIVPGKKVVFLVTESKLNWLENDKQEWTNTRMVFELSREDDKTVLQFTQEGLVPGMECYERCSQGWDMVIKDHLFNFITAGKTI